ncbi:hypothetical protein C1645_740736 [Glomus cerebriforme]|uniref:Uncharacterized protein n=1 Tax=Glomus cerebriforme TaxID=658196 RepID=A0A397SUK5_9GLOM|nr:hypothetical protein C1645_740736 [Glomus cerebriforme]
MKRSWGFLIARQYNYQFENFYVTVIQRVYKNYKKRSETLAKQNPKYYHINKKYNFENIIRISDCEKYREDDTWYPKDKLREIIHQIDDAYEGVSSLQNIKESKQEEPLTKNEIETNLCMLKTNLKNSKAPYAHHFRKYLKKKSASDLSWHIPLTSQVICADLEIVRILEVEAYNFFIERYLEKSHLQSKAG